MFVRNREKRYPVIQEIGGKSMTKQADREACDINVIMRKYETTGVLEHFRSRSGFFDDVSSVGSFLEAQLQVKAAQEIFEGLPAEVREACGNDPVNLVDLMLNEDRRAEAEELGLLASKESVVSSTGGSSPAESAPASDA